MSDATILWRRLDQPGHESARVLFEHTHWRLAGSAVFLYESKPCRLDYSVVCDAEWRTEWAAVAGWVGDDSVRIDLTVDGAQRWRLNGTEYPAVAGCIDLDLNFSPSTNLLPIRRLALPAGESAEVRAAWLRFPEFVLEPLDQVYRRTDVSTYRYESAGGRFTTELEVNSVGLVTRYPGFWDVEGVVRTETAE